VTIPSSNSGRRRHPAVDGRAERRPIGHQGPPWPGAAGTCSGRGHGLRREARLADATLRCRTAKRRSCLLMLYLTATVTLDDIKASASWGSRTPATRVHQLPGRGHHRPLGQGLPTCRHGPGRALVRTQFSRGSSTTTLRGVRRRLPRGRQSVRGGFTGRAPAARPPRLRLHDNTFTIDGVSRARPERRRRRPVRGLRLARRVPVRLRRSRRARRCVRRAMAVDDTSLWCCAANRGPSPDHTDDRHPRLRPQDPRCRDQAVMACRRAVLVPTPCSTSPHAVAARSTRIG